MLNTAKDVAFIFGRLYYVLNECVYDVKKQLNVSFHSLFYFSVIHEFQALYIKQLIFNNDFNDLTLDRKSKHFQFPN